MDTFNKLTDSFRQFPGIGPRQAKRFVYFLLSCEPSFLVELTDHISTLKRDITQCTKCYRFFARRTAASHCPICADEGRATGELMVVAKDTDLDAMEKSNTYRGKYFVLGGTISLLEKRNTHPVRLKEFQARIEQEAKQGVLREVILALSANPDGEHTADELRELLAPYAIKVSTLGRGLSTGSELEYADKATLASAFINRSS